MRTKTDTVPANAEQGAMWNGPSGNAWIDAQALLDDLFAPFERRLGDAVSLHAARRVLDVGCGTGSTTLAAARRAGPQGRCVGIDISAPMLAVARARADHEGSTAQFICGDAQTHAFDAAAYDLIISRFGVMFFDAPVAAFANLRHAVANDAALCCFVWRSAAENPFMTTAERTAAPLLPTLPARDANAAGQFALADRGHVSAILERSGWTDIDIQAVDVPCHFPASALETYFTRLGPLARALQSLDAAARAPIVDAVRAAFERYVHGDQVRFDAACWMVGAQARAPHDRGRRT